MIDVNDPLVVPVFQSTVGLVVWLAATVLMPIVVGLVTTWTTPAAVKSLLLVGLSLANGVLSAALAAGGGFDWGKALIQAAVSFVIAGASYARVWKPTGVIAAVTNIGSAVKYRKVDSPTGGALERVA